jgi:amidase
MSSQPAWIDIARRKQEAQKLLIPKEWTIDAEKWANQTSVTVEQVLSAETKTILSEKELQITGENDAVDIVSKIREGKLSAEEVTVAFCKRAAVAHQLVR